MWRCLLKDQLLAQITGPEMLRAGGDLAHWGPGVSWCGSGTKTGWRQQWQEKGLKSTLRVDGEGLGCWVEGLERPTHRTHLLQEGALCSQSGREPRQ